MPPVEQDFATHLFLIVEPGVKVPVCPRAAGRVVVSEMGFGRCLEQLPLAPNTSSSARTPFRRTRAFAGKPIFPELPRRMRLKRRAADVSHTSSCDYAALDHSLGIGTRLNLSHVSASRLRRSMVDAANVGNAVCRVAGHVADQFDVCGRLPPRRLIF